MDELDHDVPLGNSLVPGNAKAANTTPADRLAEATAAIKEQQATHAEQNTLWRRILFWGVSGIVALVVILEVLVVITYAKALKQPPDPVVMSTWLVTSVAQVIGLLLVITRHLFPGSNGDS